MNQYTVDEFGAEKWWDEYGRLHRIDGPALVYNHGSKYWYVNGLQHRIDGPAYIRANGTKFWFINGLRHREDGPAIEWADGSKYWYVNGLRISSKDVNEWIEENNLVVPFDEPTQMLFLMKFG